MTVVVFGWGCVIGLVFGLGGGVEDEEEDIAGGALAGHRERKGVCCHHRQTFAFAFASGVVGSGISVVVAVDAAVDVIGEAVFALVVAAEVAAEEGFGLRSVKRNSLVALLAESP